MRAAFSPEGIGSADAKVFISRENASSFFPHGRNVISGLWLGFSESKTAF